MRNKHVIYNKALNMQRRFFFRQWMRDPRLGRLKKRLRRPRRAEVFRWDVVKRPGLLKRWFAPSDGWHADLNVGLDA